MFGRTQERHPWPCRPRTRQLCYCLWLTFACLALAARPVFGQPQATPAVSPAQGDEAPPADKFQAAATDVNLPQIEQLEAEAAANDELPAEVKQRIAELYSQAKTYLNTSAKSKTQSQQYQSLIASAEERVQSANDAAEQLQRAPPTVPQNADASSLEQLLAQRQSELRKLKDEKLRLDAQATTRSARRNDIRQRLAALEQEISTVTQRIAAPAVTGDPQLLTQAKRNAALAELQALISEVPMLESELALYDAEDAHDLLQAQRSLTGRQIDVLTEYVDAINQAIQVAREESADSLADTIRAEDHIPAPLQPINAKNEKLAEKNKAIIAKIEDAETERSQRVAQLDELKQRFTLMQSKVDSLGLTASIGLMLRNDRAKLPDSRDLLAATRNRRPLIEKLQLDNFEIDEERSRLDNLDAAAKVVLDEIPDAAESDLPLVQRLLKARDEVLDALYKNQDTYFNTLAETSLAEEDTARLSDEYRDYIDQRVLWIRSHPPLLASISQADEATDDRELSDREVILAVAPKLIPAILDDARHNPVVYGGAVFLAGLLLFVRPLVARRLRHIADRARGSAYSHFTPSLHALAWNVISCLLGPLALGFLAWRFARITDPAVLSQAVSSACLASGLILLPLSFGNRVFGTNGLADAHFDWSAHTTLVLRRNMRWLTFVFIPLVFLTTFAVSLEPAAGHGVAHRTLFITSCLTLAVFAWRTLHPRCGLPRHYLEAHPGSWLVQLQNVWFWGLLLVPVALALLTILGFTYTAQELAWHGYLTLSWGGLLWISHGLFMRLLLVRRRRLAVETARARYAEYKKQQAEAAEAQKNAQETDGKSERAAQLQDSDNETVLVDLPGVSVTPNGIQMEDDPLADLRANTAQSRRLVTTFVIGAAVILMWFTWHNVLPALGFLERWPLWQSSREVTESVRNESGMVEFRSREEPDPVTIADLILAILVGVVGLVAARDLPGLLELAVLKRLPLESSIRYAITTLGSYLLIFLGLFIACRLVGLRWQQIQWMATALTFGLAFGLQEMFANFVAGIILLFERPIRVGDIVTIDEVTGVVSRVRMRATTVTNWDRKDYIVPNKDFITGRLLNWTLSDQVNRIVINVGVAYGTDTQNAKRILEQIAREHAIIEDEPAPMATFEGFGDSTLDLVLRCFIAMKNMPMRLETIDDLHTTIDKEFQAAGIEIAFPQQDIHVRDMPLRPDKPMTPTEHRLSEQLSEEKQSK